MLVRMCGRTVQGEHDARQGTAKDSHLQQLCVDLCSRELHISDYGPSDEDILDRDLRDASCAIHSVRPSNRTQESTTQRAGSACKRWQSMYSRVARFRAPCMSMTASQSPRARTLNPKRFGTNCPPYHVRELLLVDDRNVLELNVQELVDRVQCSSDLHVVLQLHNHHLTHKGLEERVEELWGESKWRASRD